MDVLHWMKAFSVELLVSIVLNLLTGLEDGIDYSAEAESDCD